MAQFRIGYLNYTRKHDRNLNQAFSNEFQREVERQRDKKTMLNLDVKFRIYFGNDRLRQQKNELPIRTTAKRVDERCLFDMQILHQIHRH